MGINTEFKYKGIIVSTRDPLKTGKYLVKIPDVAFVHGVWAKNNISRNFSRSRINKSEVSSIGSYHSLSIGMEVIVKFETNDVCSAYIVDTPTRLHLPMGPDKHTSFDLIHKSIKRTWWYIDDAIKLTHLMTNKGSTNIFSTDKKISFSTANLLNDGYDGIFINSILEIDHDSILLSVMDKSSDPDLENKAPSDGHGIGYPVIKMDRSGITFSYGKTGEERTSLSITDSGIKLYTPNKIHIESKKNHLVANSTKITSIENLDLHSPATRITGSTNLSLVGSTTNIEAAKSLFLEGLTLNLKGKTRAELESPLLSLTTLGTLYMSSTMHVESSISKFISTTNYGLNATTISRDGMIIDNMGGSTGAVGIATSTKTLMTSGNVASAAATLASSMDNVATGMTNYFACEYMCVGSASKCLPDKPINMVEDQMNIGRDVNMQVRKVNKTDKTLEDIVLRDPNLKNVDMDIN